MATAARPTALAQAPPHSLEAEQAVIGSILLDSQALTAVEGFLESGHFYHERHRHIFEAVIGLVDRGQSVDLLTLADELRRRGTLEAVGGPGYLAVLPQAVVTPENIGFHADIVRRKARLRMLITAAREILDEATSEREDADQILDAAEQRLFAITRESARRDFQPVSDVIHETLEEIERAQREGRSITGVPTGYADLDALTLGLHPSDLIIVAGRPAMGKTAFALNVALHVALRAQVGVGLFSLEMGAPQVTTRLLSTLAKVSSTQARSGRLADAEHARMEKEARNLDLAPIHIDDVPGQTIFEVRSKARRLAQRHPEIGLLIIDYLQLMSGSSDRFESRQQEIAEITRSLKGLARDLSIPVMALSQLSRKVEDRRAKNRRPILSDLRESGAIEQDADLVIFLHRPSYYEEEREADFQDTAPSLTEVIVAKHRNGPTGTINLLFFRRFTRFETMIEV